MSRPLSYEDVLFRQRFLSCSGLYTETLDGLWGQHTDTADREFLAGCNRIATSLGTFDPRSERNIRTLRLEAQPLCRQSLSAILNSGLTARVISGTRSYAEQAALYRQGRFGNKGPIVTKARAGTSFHNFGLAWDIGIFIGQAYLPDGVEYVQASRPGKVPGVEWGGDWESFKDKPHYQAPLGASTTTLARNVFENGARHA